MYATFEIKINIISKITLDEIIKLSGLNYGIMSDSYILNRNETGIYNILYDKNRIGRGIELRIDKRKIYLTIGYPNTKYEINIFYELIEKICKRLKIKYFYKDKEKLNIIKKEEYIEKDIKSSIELLKKIEQKVLLGINKNELVLGGINPIYLGKREFECIDSSIDNFEQVLHDYQNKSLTMCEPQLYKRANETIYSVFYVYENDRTVLKKNASVYPFRYNVQDHYICLGGVNYIRYNDFIDFIKQFEYYDDESIIIKISSDDVYKIIKNRCIDINSNSKTKGIFFGKCLDNVYYHEKKVYIYNFNLDPIVGCSHISAFIRYFYEKDLLNKEFLKCIPEIKDIIANKEDLRKFVLTNVYIQGLIRLDYFKKEIRNFISNYYVFGDVKGSYPTSVDMVALEYFGEEKYNCEEFKTDGYLFLPYNEDYYQRISEYIDKAYNKYLHKK